jgi:hypothetical protein
MLFKKLLLILGFIIAVNVPLNAQHTQFELSYQSFRPFIHFQININSHRSHYNAYEEAYLQGYMDGVNDALFLGGRFADRRINVRAYRSGFKDGFRDRALMIRLRGHGWYQRYRVSQNAYYVPSLAVQIWLDGLSLAFLQAPSYRLPPRWQHRAHPKFKQYRKWMNRRNQINRGKYRDNPDVERRFKKRIQHHRKQLSDFRQNNYSQITNRKNRGNNDRNHDLRTRDKKRDGWLNKLRQRIKNNGSERAKEVRRSRDRTSTNRDKVRQKRDNNRDHNQRDSRSRNH